MKLHCENYYIVLDFERVSWFSWIIFEIEIFAQLKGHQLVTIPYQKFHLNAT